MYENLLNICWTCHINRSDPERLVRRFTSLDFPTVEEIIELLQITSYQSPDACSSFEDMLEAGWNCTCRWKSRNIMLHTTVHNFIKGTLDNLAATMYDPIFILHHVQVDRLFERWRRGVLPSKKDFNNILRVPTECRDCNMPVFLPPVKYGDMFVDVRELGYTYDNYDFGSLSENVTIASRKNPKYRKTCEKWKLQMSKLSNKVTSKQLLDKNLWHSSLHFSLITSFFQDL